MVADCPDLIVPGAFGIEGDCITIGGTNDCAGGDGGLDYSKQTDDDTTAGQPVYATIAGSYKLARATGLPEVKVVGFAVADALSGFVLTARVGGNLTLTIAQWDVVTGDAGGLTPSAYYWLDPSTFGMISKTSPASAPNWSAKVGRAIDATTLAILPQYPIEL